MPLTLVLGPANSAKAGEVLGAYAERARRGALLVVPTAADADHYARELAGQGQVLGSVITFAGLSREIARRSGFAAPRLSDFQRSRILRRAVAQTRFHVLEQSARSPGFATAAGELISELHRSLISADRFGRALDSWAHQDGRRRAYAADLAAIPRNYVQTLARIGRVDAELQTWHALDALREAPGRWGADPVFFYGFDELTALERDAVETLARIVGTEVTVSLNYEPGRRAFSARAEAVEDLRALAERVHELPALDEHYAPSSREALHHLERSLFEGSSTRVDPGDAVRLLEAGGERAEAELVASEVLALLRSGVPAAEIVVVCRSPLALAPLYERVFTGYGIPVSAARRVAFRHTGLGRGLLALARCAWSPGAPAEELLSYLRSPGVLRRTEIADRLELEVRCEGVATDAEARERLGLALAEVDSLRNATDPIAELVRQARRLLAAPHRGQAAQLTAREEVEAAALAEVLHAADELRELGDGASGEELIELLEELEVGRPAEPPPEAILIADPLGIRARRFRAVFVCGLQEGMFPLPASPEPFLGDERRREISAAAGLRLRPSDMSLERERYLFYACVSRATERLFLSYRSSDEEGNLELPSPFLADVEDLLVADWPARRRQRLLADVVWEPESAPTARELARSRAASAASSAPAENRWSLSEIALGHVRHREVVSAGALETYAGCPVRWLVERELSPAQLEPQPEALLRGSYIHDLLEQLLRRLGGPITPASLPRATELLEELVAELPASVAPGRPEPLRAAVRAAIEADVRRYLREEAADGSKWRPQGLELRFGFDEEPESLPAVSICGDVRLRGVIDRLDVDPDGSGKALVRDYKTGSARPEHAGARWEQDRQLQVALYMIAVRQLLGLEPVAGLYQPIGGGDLRPRGVFLQDAPVPGNVVANDARSREQLDQLLADAEARAHELAVRLRSGDVKPCPQTCSRDGCQYPAICRS